MIEYLTAPAAGSSYDAKRTNKFAILPIWRAEMFALLHKLPLIGSPDLFHEQSSALPGDGRIAGVHCEAAQRNDVCYRLSKRCKLTHRSSSSPR